MELDCVIEGVETKEELAALRKLGGALIQGYIYSPPIPEKDVALFLSGTAEKASPMKPASAR